MVKSIETEDEIFRAYGILKSARILPVKEFMTLVSKVRLGAVAGLINVKPETVDELMISMQPATINAAAGKILTAASATLSVQNK